jgi:hypothetical protein
MDAVDRAEQAQLEVLEAERQWRVSGQFRKGNSAPTKAAVKWRISKVVYADRAIIPRSCACVSVNHP